MCMCMPLWVSRRVVPLQCSFLYRQAILGQVELRYLEAFIRVAVLHPSNGLPYFGLPACISGLPSLASGPLRAPPHRPARPPLLFSAPEGHVQRHRRFIWSPSFWLGESASSLWVWPVSLLDWMDVLAAGRLAVCAPYPRPSLVGWPDATATAPSCQAHLLK